VVFHLIREDIVGNKLDGHAKLAALRFKLQPLETLNSLFHAAGYTGLAHIHERTWKARAFFDETRDVSLGAVLPNGATSFDVSHRRRANFPAPNGAFRLDTAVHFDPPITFRPFCAFSCRFIAADQAGHRLGWSVEIVRPRTDLLLLVRTADGEIHIVRNATRWPNEPGLRRSSNYIDVIVGNVSVRSSEMQLSDSLVIDVSWDNLN
jgi:hypothetical protein